MILCKYSTTHSFAFLGFSFVLFFTLFFFFLPLLYILYKKFPFPSCLLIRLFAWF
ncbi:uncharacterized protein BDW47DRAFT_106850 [Aspergillus candidus]|uniref:Uncharacterized protein n=1 Tax=Aspergillus candidus TaxID=41067 RepID=A0A2I2FAC6_ASPCN|nr:hypothetical protein BDW47DRAFT_106850 [Aspergillus candidus]PLB37575.1 hypothetical protein BDW47DRAFT_106850 [Aspergillus candidus]